MPVSIMIPSLLCRVVSLRANETPAPPGFLLCGRDARTPRVPLMRTRRPHPQGSSYAGETPAHPGCLLCERDARTSQGSSYAGETPAHPGFLLCERDARTSQGASYADETPAPPRVPLMRTRRPRTQAVRERAPFQSTGMQRTQRRSQSASIHSTPDLQPSRL